MSEIRNEDPDRDPDKFLHCINETIEVFRRCDDTDSYGVAILLKMELSENTEELNLAWNAFKRSKPENLTGIVECAAKLIQLDKLDNFKRLEAMMKGIGHAFSVCKTLLEPNSRYNLEKVISYNRFYGLHHVSESTFEIFPSERPFLLELVSRPSKMKQLFRKKLVQLPKSEVYENLVDVYVRRLAEWIKVVAKKLGDLRNKHVVCKTYAIGSECTERDADSTPCTMLHQSQTAENHKIMIQLDVLMVELESIILSEANNMPPNTSGTVKDILREMTKEGEKDFEYKACFCLWNDLVPVTGHPVHAGDDSRTLLTYICEKDRVQKHLKFFILDQWKSARFSKSDETLDCRAVKETDVFLVFEFLYHLFGLHEGKNTLNKSPVKEMRALEGKLDKEILRHKGGARFQTSSSFFKYSIVMSPEDRSMNVECIAHRFSDAYELISERNDPFEAVIKFNKFMNLLDSRRSIGMFPNLDAYIMWVEFYTTVAFLLVAKLKNNLFPNLLMVVPNNYLHLLSFISATFPNKRNIHDIISGWTIKKKEDTRALKLIQDRLTYIACGVSGHNQRVQIFDHVLMRCQREPHMYGLLERIIVLALTFVSNVGQTTTLETEFNIMKLLAHVHLAQDAPERLRKLVDDIKSTEGIRDIVKVLSGFVKARERNEDMVLCNWVQEQRGKDKIEVLPLKSDSDELFADEFLHEETADAMSDKYYCSGRIDTVPEAVEEQTEEEIQKGKEEKATQKVEERRTHAAKSIQYWYKYILRRRQGTKTEKSNSIDQLFEAVTIDDERCMICGTYFQETLDKDTTDDLMVTVDAKSTVNVGETKNAWGVVQRQHSENAWFKPQENTEDMASKARLQDIRHSHEATDAHYQNVQGLQVLRNKLKEQFAPIYKEIKEFLYSGDLHLENAEYVKSHYDKHQMDIDRMLALSKTIENEAMELYMRRTWSEFGTLQSLIKELESDYNTVKVYVLDMDQHQKQVCETSMYALLLGIPAFNF